MSLPIKFSITPIGDGCHVLNERDRTVAIVTSQGYIDWLLRGPATPGPLLHGIRKETHLSYVLGLKLLLHMPHLSDARMTGFQARIGDDGRTATLTGEAVSADGRFASTTSATIHVNPVTEWYEWDLTTVLQCRADQPVELSWIEYNNIYPAGCGRCMLFAPEKKYHSTLMVDSAQRVWEFPHQHTMHYGRKIPALTFARGSLAGFFGEQDGSPVCIVHESDLEPDWAICDMYYDLHCGARTAGPIVPGEEVKWRYTIKYLTPAESRPFIEAARPVPVTDADREQHLAPRLELGLNHMDEPILIDRMDDASCFRPAPPGRVWDRDVGHKRKGSLRLTNAEPQETVWSAVPPTQIPASTEFTLAALAKTENVEGRGLYLRVRYHTFVWYPTPHVEWVKTLCSRAVTGTSDGWVRLVVPKLEVPEEHFDYLLWIDVVLEGKGRGWLTDIDVDLVHVRSPVHAES
ncbi:MAG: hypothetical protein BWZ02_02574 [Lentisphaerae bacterium ADurb.BinA184]|nr:MAG: hypothetical protein BWZ02_02574 [Lentisphaerae bacterium ADurb.BinA184]